MARSIPAAILAALGQPEVYPFYAVEMLFDSGAIRLWTGYGDRGIGETIAASAIQVGKQYVIKTVGTTDFTLIGAASNTVGQSFIATAAGSGTGTVSFAYLGAGTVLSISGIDEVNDLSAKSATISLNGILSSIVSLALSEPYQRRVCRILWGVTNVSDFVEVFGGYMNTMAIEDSGETSNITLTIESKLIELNRPRVRRYTHESQKSRFPNDTFFSYVADLQDRGIVWGRKTA